ncbi:hypothetical protein BBJ28_00003915 [Nothophytophthora sp. Chile5]|nr:hypothetical protein BBJ28_00003915 [Nothophytophthora sp. Chile5]
MPRLSLRFCMATIMLVFVALLAMGLTLSDPSSHDLSSPELTTVKHRQTSEFREAARPTVEVVSKYPHDAAAFTQGFTVVSQGTDKFFIESTGLFGQSSLRRVDIASGRVLEHYDLPKELFGEGVTVGPGGELVMLTWKSKLGFVFDLKSSISGSGTGEDADSFTLTRQFNFETVTGEGWGIDYDGNELVVSDGSSTLLFWDPSTMKEVRRVDVTMYGGEQRVSQLNELEVANGFIYANVWYQPFILKIDPQTGAVVTVFDCSNVIADAGVDVASGAVLNGIAYDGEEDVFYLTGKLWGAVYKVRLLESTK